MGEILKRLSKDIVGHGNIIEVVIKERENFGECKTLNDNGEIVNWYYDSTVKFWCIKPRILDTSNAYIDNDGTAYIVGKTGIGTSKY